MFYSTKIILDMENSEIISRDIIPYDGPWEMAKGGGQSKRAFAIGDTQRQQELQLMQQQLGLQQGQINMVNPQLQAIIANGGMLPAQQAAMTSQALNQLPQDFRQTAGSINDALAARGISGGSMAGSGDIGRNFGQLGALEDYMKSNALQNIQLAKGQGLQNAMGQALNIGQMYGGNMMGFNSGAGSALGSMSGAAGNADQQSSSMWGSVMGALGAGLQGAAMAGAI